MNLFIIVGYYTKDTLYEERAKHFIQSLKKFKVPFYIEPIENLGNWNKNTAYKPTFLKKMLIKFPIQNVVYVDCDAEILRYPKLFETIEGDVAVHLFDRSCYSKSHQGFEVLSGTIFLRNNERAFGLVEQWESLCSAQPGIWDQKHLEKVLNGNFSLLPGEYCKIFDRWNKRYPDPVIVHYQASRQVRKRGGRLD